MWCRSFKTIRGIRLYTFIFDFFPKSEIVGPLNLNPLEKARVFMEYGLLMLTNLIAAGTGKVSAVLTIAHIFMAKLNFSQKMMTRQELYPS